MVDMGKYIVEMLNITKFPGIIANDNVTLQLKNTCLLGENGAGKST